MAWIFFQDMVEPQPHLKESCELSLIVKSSAELSAYYCEECEKVRLTELRYGMTCEHSKNGTLQVPLTLSPGGSPARILALQELVRDWTASEADYFLRSLGLYASLDQHSFTWKMSQGCLFEGWTGSAQSWPRYGMIVDGECYQLSTWERRTYEKESGLLPTPVTIDTGSRVNKSASAGAKERPTLGAMAYRGLLPTPTRRDYKNSIGSDEGRHTETLAHQAYKISGQRGPLSPLFVEWMMGLPTGATELEPWETVGCLKQRVRRSKDSAELKEAEACQT